MDGIYTPMIRDYAPPDTRAEAILGRLKQVPRLLRQGRQNITRPPKIFTETAILSADGALGFFDSALVDFTKTVRSASLRKELSAAAETAKRATRSFRSHLETEDTNRPTVHRASSA